MNKDQLQQELLQKIKTGIKPSDLKKKSEGETKLYAPDWNTPSDRSILKPSQPKQILTPPPLPPSKPAKTKQSSPPSEIEPATNRDKSLNKNPIKSKVDSKEPEPKLYLFTCDICEQNKKSQWHLAKVNGLAIDPTKTQKICSPCFRKVDIIQAPKEEFF